MNSIKVTEIVANKGLSCAYKSEQGTLGVARRNDDGHWQLRLSCGQCHQCDDFDEMRCLIRNATPNGSAYFDRRRIRVRNHSHGRLAVA